MPTTGDTAILRYGADNKWHYDYLSPGTSSVLSFGSAGATQVTGMGYADGQLPRCKLPLSVMDMNLAAPLTLTGNVISIAGAATTLAAVATSGSYNDLSSRPTLGTAAAQNASVFATAAQGTLAASALQPGALIPWSTITSTPTSLSGYGILDGVSVNGSYANPSWVTSFAYSKLTGAPSLATVATTGAYSDLTGKPTIPAAQVNSDWNASSGLAQILNKPTLGTAAAQNTSAFDASGAAASAQAFAIQRANQTGTQAWSTLTATPTTLSGYGITDATSNARSAITLTTTGTSGASTYNTGTGALNIPIYTPASRAFTNGQSRTVVTNQTANGTQLSTTRDAQVRGIVSIQNTTTIGGPSQGSIVFEICATNSATGTDWVTVDILDSRSTATLAVVLNLIQYLGKAIGGMIPAGWYHRYRATTAAGTITYSTTASCQEVLL